MENYACWIPLCLGLLILASIALAAQCHSEPKISSKEETQRISAKAREEMDVASDQYLRELENRMNTYRERETNDEQKR